MKQTEIEAIFTAKVTEYINKGYTFSLTTMNGSQGEIAKVDVRKGEEVIRIMLEQKSEHVTEFRTGECVVLTIGRSIVEDKNRRPFDTFGTTLWNNRLEVIEQRKFFQIDPEADYFIESREEFIKMLNKQFERYSNHNRYSHEYLDGEALEIGKRYIMRTIGIRRVSTKNIRVRKITGRKVGYIVEYHSRTFSLH